MSRLKEYLQSELPQYMLPSVYVKLDQIPLSQNNKVDKKALPIPQFDTIIKDETFVEAQSVLERKLEEIWKKVLGIDKIGVNNNFFELGGTSLDCIALEAECKKQGIDFVYEKIKENATIYEQAQFLLGNKIEGMNHGRKRESMDSLQPFNDLYFINCFYNSLFPVFHWYQTDIASVITQYQFWYETCQTKSGLILKMKIWERDAIEQIIEKAGIHAGYYKVLTEQELKKTMDAALKKQECIILWIDSFYEPNRRDTYQKMHFAHTLVFYKKAGEQYVALEHSHKDALNYKEQEFSWEIVWNSYKGYQDNLRTEKDRYTVIHFYGKDHMEVAKDWKAEWNQNYNCCKENIKNGIEQLEEYAVNYTVSKKNVENLIENENILLDFKRAQLYTIKKVMPQCQKIITCYETLIPIWETIRNQHIRYKKGMLAECNRKEHRNALQQIIEMEKQIFTAMDGGEQEWNH